MSVTLHLDVIRQIMAATKDGLARERQQILLLHPLLADDRDWQLPLPAWRQNYAFAYLRAERLVLLAIGRRLADIEEFVTTKIDTSGELGAASRTGLKGWTKNSEQLPQDEFGNPFVHAVTRTMLAQQAVASGLKAADETIEVMELADRIGRLFRDLACVISIIHCCSLLAERDLQHVPLLAPRNLQSTARELAELVWLALTASDLAEGTAALPAAASSQDLGPKLRLVHDSNHIARDNPNA